MEELARGSEASGLGHEAFCDALAKRIAHRYLDGSLDFDAADAAINNLHCFAFRPPEFEPGHYMWSVYHAFDAGEYLRPGDSPDISLADRYTRPQLLAIVAGGSPE